MIGGTGNQTWVINILVFMSSYSHLQGSVSSLCSILLLCNIHFISIEKHRYIGGLELMNQKTKQKMKGKIKCESSTLTPEIYAF